MTAVGRDVRTGITARPTRRYRDNPCHPAMVTSTQLRTSEHGAISIVLTMLVGRLQPTTPPAARLKESSSSAYAALILQALASRYSKTSFGKSMLEKRSGW